MTVWHVRTKIGAGLQEMRQRTSLIGGHRALALNLFGLTYKSGRMD